jgi:competence protein ComEC
VLLAEFGAQRVLLTGDIPARQEAELLAREAPAPITLLAAPHHGSRHSSTAAFIAATRPRWVLFQAGYRNRFGHPDAGVLAAWVAAGSRAARSDYAGALQWRLRAQGEVEAPSAARDALRRYWHNRPGSATIGAPRESEGQPTADEADSLTPGQPADGPQTEAAPIDPSTALDP